MGTNKKLIKLIWLGILLAPTIAHAQTGADRDKIAASQASASPIYFETQHAQIPLIEPGDFNKEDECKVRGGLPNFFAKINAGKAVTVAFIGGSITQANFGYRLQTANYLEHTYPKAKFKWINAGVSGTGTELGAFRIGEHVLNHQPDLIFIEFAVNGAYPDAMEGIIRQAVQLNPQLEICLIYTILNGQTTFYQKNELPTNIVGLERVAEHYNLPSINLAMEASVLEATGKLMWKGNAMAVGQGQTLFSEDGIHPTTAGGNLYAAAIARGFLKISAAKQPKKLALPVPLIGSSWDKASMIDLSTIEFERNGWNFIPTATHPNLKKFSPWFANVLTATRPGASFSFKFKGDMVGVFDVGGPEVGQLEWIIDGKPMKLNREKQGSFTYYQALPATNADALNRFNAYCNNRYRGQFDVIKLTEGEHLVTVTLSAQKPDKLNILPADQRADILANPEKYNQTVVYLGRVLMRGTLLR